MTTDDRFLAKIKAEIDYYRAALERLDSGGFRIGEIGENGQLIDRTQWQIDTIKRIIDTLQSVLDRG